MKQLFVIIALLFCLLGFAQEKTKIRLIQADLLDSRAIDATRDINVCIGDVIFEHDSAYLFCDTAYIDNMSNSLDAFGNVRLKLSDTLNLYGDSLKYNGDTKIVRVFENVILKDNKTTLYTNYLIYDRNIKRGFYPDDGKIVDEENTLISKKGYYFSERKQFFFKDSVVVTNPDFKMFSDTLLYNSASKIVTFLGPTDIIGEKNSLYSKRGWYDTRLKKSEMRDDVILRDGAQSVSGDSIFYNQKTNEADVYNNVVIHDTVENTFITGNYAEYRKSKGYAYVVDSAQAMMIENNDTLFMHADTLRVLFDTLDNMEFIKAYYGMKFYRSDMQGCCDSLVYVFSDSIIQLYDNPILWSLDNQITSDTIFLFSGENHMDSLKLYNNGFIISRDSTNSYNQIKGHEITGYFDGSELRRIRVDKNAESLYYMRTEDKELIGIDKAVSNWLYIILKDNQLSRIVYRDNANAKTYPEEDLPENARLLKGFLWHFEKRPTNRYDIFE